MKLLKEYFTLSEAEESRTQLREAGILTSIESAGASQLYGVTGVMKVALWVVLDEQTTDAEALMDNPLHEVRHKLTEGEMQALEGQGKAQMATLVKYAVIGVSILLALVAAFLFLYIR